VQVIGGTVCAKSDVWALGMTVMQLLLGRAPFEKMDELAVTQAIVQGPAPRLSRDAFAEEVPVVICCAVVMCCC
jgi:serine/threonine protein kinase